MRHTAGAGQDPVDKFSRQISSSTSVLGLELCLRIGERLIKNHVEAMGLKADYNKTDSDLS